MHRCVQCALALIVALIVAPKQSVLGLAAKPHRTWKPTEHSDKNHGFAHLG